MKPLALYRTVIVLYIAGIVLLSLNNGYILPIHRTFTHDRNNNYKCYNIIVLTTNIHVKLWNSEFKCTCTCYKFQRLKILLRTKNIICHSCIMYHVIITGYNVSTVVFKIFIIIVIVCTVLFCSLKEFIILI